LSNEHIKDRVRQQFGGSSAAYATSRTHRSGNDLDRLVALAECRPDVEALDIATGAGHTGKAIAPLVCHVVLSDLTPEMLDTARAEMQAAGIHNVSFRVADAEELQFDDASFDLVTCRIAPHHFPNVQRAAFEVARVLRPGGLFMLIDSTAPDEPELDRFLNELEWRRDGSHVRSCTKPEWLNMLNAAGLDVEQAEDFEKTHDFADWTARSRMTDQERDELEQWVLGSPESCRVMFKVVVEDGRIVTFTDRKTLFKCRKLG
jgi:ubiquinone/menaquinone biosynthesis C-methylase UbiE